MEKLRESCKGHHLKDRWNKEESGCFFKAPSTKDLVRKRKDEKMEKSQGKEWQLRFLLVVVVKKLSSK